jgi:hypothetical protein
MATCASATTISTIRTMTRAAGVDTAHGRTWHVPSNAPRTQEQALTDVMAAAGRPASKVSQLPRIPLVAAAAFVPMVREINQLSYQWARPYVLDDSAARSHFSMQPTPWDEVCRRTVGV